LKTLEKINRKGIRNSRKKENSISAQPARAHAGAPVRADRQPPPVSLSHPRALSPLSLLLPGGPVLSAPFSLSTHTFSLAGLRTPPVRPPSLTSARTPAVDASTSARFLATSARPRPFRARTPLVHFPLLICALSRALALRAQPGSSAAAHRSSPPVPRPLLGARHARCLGKLRHITRNSGHPSIRPLPLWFAWSTLTGSLPHLRHRRPMPSPCPDHRSCVPETSLKVTILTPPLFSPVSHLLARDCSPEYSPVHRGLPSAVQSPQSHSHKPDPAIVFARSSPTSPATPTDLSRPGVPVCLASSVGVAVPAGSGTPSFPTETKSPGAHPIRPTLIGRPDLN
jgi:hypothetical protein